MIAGRIQRLPAVTVTAIITGGIAATTTTTTTAKKTKTTMGAAGTGTTTDTNGAAIAATKKTAHAPQPLPTRTNPRLSTRKPPSASPS
ncbi:hypothetical protein Micbo1qcDRAFT_156516, partial [Microdochium bolleyi]